MKSIFKKFLCAAALVTLCAFTGTFASAKPVCATLSLKCSDECESFEKGDEVILYVGNYSVNAKVKSVVRKVFVDCSDVVAYSQALENPLAQFCRGGPRGIQSDTIEEIVTAFVTVQYDDRNVAPIFSSDFALRMNVGRDLELYQSGRNMRDAVRCSGMVNARLWMFPFVAGGGVCCSYRYC